MSIRACSDDTTYNISVASIATEKTDRDNNALKSHYQQGGRHYLIDPDTDDRVSISRLTAYAEYGEKIREKDAHHEIPLLKVDAPRFLDALTREEHTEYHKKDPNPVEVDGFPVFRTGL